MTGEVALRQAWDEYVRLGVETRDWVAWAGLFSHDATYFERGQRRSMVGAAAVGEWIVPEMAGYPYLSLWMEWCLLDGDKVAMYIWNNLPDPTGSGRRFGFPNSTFLAHAGDGTWAAEWDHYSSQDARDAYVRWLDAGGDVASAEPDWGLRGIDGWTPALPVVESTRDEVDEAVVAWAGAAGTAWTGGDVGPWLAAFVADARIRDHGLGALAGMRSPAEWFAAAGARFADVDVSVPWWLVDGNRVAAFVELAMGDVVTDACAILHYAGGGQFAYEELVFNPAELAGPLELVSGSSSR